MRLPLILSGLFVIAAAFVPAPAVAQPDPGVCVGSACPGGYPACVTGINPRFDFCVADPQCIAIVWFDQHVGP